MFLFIRSSSSKHATRISSFTLLRLFDQLIQKQPFEGEEGILSLYIYISIYDEIYGIPIWITLLILLKYILFFLSFSFTVLFFVTPSIVLSIVKYLLTKNIKKNNTIHTPHHVNSIRFDLSIDRIYLFVIRSDSIYFSIDRSISVRRRRRRTTNERPQAQDVYWIESNRIE